MSCVRAAWNSDKLPIYEPGLEDVVKVARDRGNLKFSTDFTKYISEADIIFVRCVSDLSICTVFHLGLHNLQSVNPSWLDNRGVLQARIARHLRLSSGKN